jgi:hypothetical protein
MRSAAGSMIVKTLFLAKKIHRIGARNLRGKKGLPQNPGHVLDIIRITGIPGGVTPVFR